MIISKTFSQILIYSFLTTGTIFSMARQINSAQTKDELMRLHLANHTSPPRLRMQSPPRESMIFESQNNNTEKELLTALERKRKEKEDLQKEYAKQEADFKAQKTTFEVRSQAQAKEEKQKLVKELVKTGDKLLETAALLSPGFAEAYQKFQFEQEMQAFGLLALNGQRSELIKILKKWTMAKKNQYLTEFTNNSLLDFYKVFAPADPEDGLAKKLLNVIVAASISFIITPAIVNRCTEAGNKLVSRIESRSLNHLKSKSHCSICNSYWHLRDDHFIPNQNGSKNFIENPTTSTTVLKSIARIFYS